MSTLNIDDVSESYDVTSDTRKRRPKLTEKELSELRAFRNDLPLFHFVLSITLVFATPFIMHIYASVWAAVICVLINMHTFNRFAQIVHGSDHAGLFRNKKWDNIVGHVAGWFLGYSRDGHKDTHDSHHYYLNTELDSDRVWCEPEAKVGSLFRGWARDLFLVSAAQRFLQYIPKHDGKSKFASSTQTEPQRSGFNRLLRLFAPITLVQLSILLDYQFVAGGFQYYFFLYVLPLFMLYPAQIRLRSTVEHSFPVGHACVNPEDFRIIRSVKANWFERFLIAPLYIEYHYEHHILPTMPYYNAPKMRQMLEKKGFSVPLANGYFAFVLNKWRAERTFEAAAIVQ